MKLFKHSTYKNPSAPYSISKRLYLNGTLITFLLWCFLSPLHAQHLPITSDAKKTSGIPFIKNYKPDVYQADAQNWAIIQDQRGIMYFGNSDGILEYDGVSWRLIKTTNKTVIRSLAIDQNNRIFVGAYGEIGYLAPDDKGLLQYSSLLPYVDEKQRDFSDVWQTIVTDHGVYFSTQKYIFHWADEQMKVWETETAFLLTTLVNNQLYVRQWKTGLFQIVGDSLELAPNGEALIQNRTSAMLPYASDDGPNDIMIFSQTQGLFRWDGLLLKPFPTRFDDLLTKARIYKAVQLSNGDYAITTIQDGVFIMDKAGNLLHHLNKATGLPNNAVWALYQDKQDGLWLGLDIGISRVELSVPLRYFSDREGVEGAVFSVIRHQGTLYTATSSGIYYLDEDPTETAPLLRQFTRVSDIPPQAWALLSVGSSLLGGTFQGVYEIKGGKAYLVHRGYVFSLYRSRQDTNRVFTGLQGGLGSLYYSNGQWRDEGLVKGINQEIRDMVETPLGELWLTTRYQGLLQVDFSDGFTLEPKIASFDTLQGLPAGDRNVAFTTSAGLRFATPQGLYRFDEKRQQFMADTAFIKGLPNPKDPLFAVVEDHEHNLWMLRPEGETSGIAIRQADGTFTWDASPLLRTNDGDFNVVYPDPWQKGVTWFGGNERLVQFDATLPKNDALDFKTLIRQVIANTDSLLYGGAETGKAEAIVNIPALNFAFNSLRFQYAAGSFDDESKNEYQYFLEGFDKNWSKWSTDAQKDYTNLPEGNYRFQVRAKNGYQQIGSTAIFTFKILPPFYRSWWAYTLYVLFALAILYGIWQYELKRLGAKHLKDMKLLEYEKLKELDQMKSRFFADISHEFRTPLTLILGPLNNVISRSKKQEDLHEFSLMKRNAQRLLRLINQLLDLSRLEAGKMKLEAHNEDIIPFLKGLFYAFESQAVGKKISLHFETTMEQAIVYFDPDKMEQVFQNVLSNALKFTPEGGRVSLKVSKVISNNAAAVLGIMITDTGIGISAEHLAYVFDRFYQADNAYRKDGQGSGIGLALAKELVELHQGQIKVDSKLEEGTQFTILLPLAQNLTKLPSRSSIEVGKKTTSNPLEMESLQESRALSETAQSGRAESSDTTDLPIVLLVEDNIDMRAFIRTQLVNTYQVIEAVDGQEGIEKAIEFTPDLIISDVMMPRADGLQLCDMLKKDERTSHIPIILLTAKVDIESKLAGLDRGADAYLAKPFNKEELLLRSRKLLELRQRLRERYATLQPLAPVEDKDLQIEDAFLKKTRLIVEQHLADVDFDMDQFARLVGMSRSQLFRKIKVLTGNSPSVFIRTIRLNRGKELLQSTSMNVTEVAYEVGFSTPTYFSDAFLEAFGVRPSELRQ